MATHEDVARPELARMVRGKGQFLDDVKLQGMCYAAFVRSEHAHANIVSIDFSAAMEVPGAIGVITPEEVLPHVNPVRPAAPGSNEFARPYDRFPMPPGKVTFVGDPIVAVAAETPHAAEDMAEAVIVEYDPLPVVGGAEQAMAPDAPVIHAGMDDNIVFYRQFGDGDVDGAFGRSSLVLEKTFNFPRQTGVPLEGRGVIANYDQGQERLTVWASCRSPHLVKTTVSNVMRLPQHAVRVISGDVGGEFGIKGAAYPESIILSFLSRKVDRPVKWVEDRMESLMACGHAHEMAVDVSVAAQNDGRILGIRARVVVDQGAHTLGPTSAGLEPMTTGQSIVGPYRIDNFVCDSYGVLTNKCPGAAYRGCRHGAGHLRHRASDGHAGGQVGAGPGGCADEELHPAAGPAVQHLGRTALRQRRLPRYPGEAAGGVGLPEVARGAGRGTGARRAGGHRNLLLRRALQHRLAGLQKRGVYGLPAFDSATIRVDAGGNILAAVSAKSTGQSHDSVFALLVARELGVPYETVKILEGDTDVTPFGSGTGVSRSAVSTGGAIRLAAQDIRRKATEIATFFLETENEELQIADGQIFDPADPAKSVSFAAVAAGGARRVPDRFAA